MIDNSKLQNVRNALNLKDLYHTEKLLNEIRTDNEDTNEYMLLHARYLIEKHFLDEALILLTKVINSEPDNVEAYIYRGKLYVSKGEKELGYLDFKKALKYNEDNIDLKFYLGRSMINCRKYEEAREIYKELLHYSKNEEVLGYFQSANNYIVDIFESKPDLDVKEKISLSRSYYYLNNIDKALGIVNSIKDIESNFEACLMLSSIYRIQKEYKKSEYYVDKALKLEPENPRVYFNKAMIEEERENNKEALENYSLCINKDENYKPVYNKLSSLMIKLNMFEEALAIVDKSLQLNYDKEVSLNNKGEILFNLGKNEEAIKYFDDAIENFNKYIKAYINKSKVFRSEKRYQQSFDICDKAYYLASEDYRIGIEKAILLKDIGQYNNAIEWIDWVIDINENNYEAYYIKALCLCELNQDEEALECINKAIQLKPNKINLYCAKILIYSKIEKEVNYISIIQEYYQSTLVSDVDIKNKFICEIENMMRWKNSDDIYKIVIKMLKED